MANVKMEMVNVKMETIESLNMKKYFTYQAPVSRDEDLIKMYNKMKQWTACQKAEYVMELANGEYYQCSHNKQEDNPDSSSVFECMIKNIKQQELVEVEKWFHQVAQDKCEYDDLDDECVEEFMGNAQAFLE